MPRLWREKARQSLPPDYVYEPPREMVYVPFVQLVDVAHVQGQVTISTTHDSAFGETWIEMLPASMRDSHPADASSTHEPGYGAGV